MHRAVGALGGQRWEGIRSGDAHSLMGPVQEWKPRPGTGTCRVWASTFGFGGTHSSHSTTHAHAWYPRDCLPLHRYPHPRSHPEPLTTFSFHLCLQPQPHLAVRLCPWALNQSCLMDKKFMWPVSGPAPLPPPPQGRAPSLRLCEALTRLCHLSQAPRILQAKGTSVSETEGARLAV